MVGNLGEHAWSSGGIEDQCHTSHLVSVPWMRYPTTLPTGSFLIHITRPACRPVLVVDTDALLTSIDNHRRTGRNPYLLRMAELRSARTYVGVHVYKEAYQGFSKIERIPRHEGVAVLSQPHASGGSGRARSPGERESPELTTDGSWFRPRAAVLPLQVTTS